MTTFERRQQLIEILRKQPGLRVPELADLLGVSQGTIRNDLTALDQEGRVTRVHGGATVNDELQVRSQSFTARSRKNAAAKQAIARWASELVEDGDSILLDASSTVFALTTFLQNRKKLRVITNGIDAARALASNPTNTVLLLGGALNPEGSSTSGPTGEQLLQGLHIKTAFVSGSGYTPEIGLTEVHLNEAQLKMRMIETAQKVIALVDATKFGKVDLTPFVRTDQITQLYTDQSLPPEWFSRLQEANLTFSICSEGSVTAYTPGGKEKEHYRIGFANLSERSPFAAAVRKSVERAALEAGNIDLVLADNQLDPEVALKIAEGFLSQDLDLMIEYQIDEQMGNRIMSLFHDAGIPVISVDIPMIGATYFGVDNYRAGQIAGLALGEWLRDTWNGQVDMVVALVEPRAGAIPATRIRTQMEGLQAVIGVLPEEKCVTLNSGNTCEVSEREMISFLKANPGFRRLAVVCFNDDAAIGVLAAARKLGREEDLVIVGQGADRRVREEIAQPGSRIIGSTEFSPEKYGDRLIPLVLSILRGEPVPPAVYMEHSFLRAAGELRPSTRMDAAIS